MSDYKSGWPPGPPSQAAPPGAEPLPMAPPRSIPPAVTPQRIPVPTSSPPSGGPVSQQAEAPPPAVLPRPLTAQELVDLDAEVVEAPDEEAESPAATAAVLQPMRPMRRLAIADADASSGPPPAGPPSPTPPSAGPSSGSPPPAAPGPSIAHLSKERDRLPSFDDLPSFADPEHLDSSSALPPRVAPSPVPMATGHLPSDPDEVDTPVPAAPVHVSAPPPFVPPPSPLLPEFASVPPLAPPPASPSPPPHPLQMRDRLALTPESEPPPAPKAEPRPSRPPPVLPDAVVLAMQPAAYQTEGAEADEHALEDEEMRLSETDLEISITGEPPEVISSLGEESPPAPQARADASGALPVSQPVVAEAPVPAERAVEAPVPDIAVVTSVADGAADAAPVSDGKKPPPPKRTAKPALPSAAIRRRPWWETLFGDDFARAHRSPTPRQLAHEVNFMVTSLALTQSQVVLDLGCGQGEHAVELTRRGVAVVGYDLSVFQLAMAGDRAQQEGQKINFLQGDMREMAFDAMFDAVVCWDTTFGYFEEEKNLDVARRILAGLKPGGSLLLHVMNRDFAAKESPANIWFEGDGCVCMDDVDFDWITSRLRVKRSLILDDGRSKELHYSVRLYDLSEIGKLLHEVGFRVAYVSGDVSTPGAFFGPASPYIIIRAQRP